MLLLCKWGRMASRVKKAAVLSIAMCQWLCSVSDRNPHHHRKLIFFSTLVALAQQQVGRKHRRKPASKNPYPYVVFAHTPGERAHEGEEFATVRLANEAAV